MKSEVKFCIWCLDKKASTSIHNTWQNMAQYMLFICDWVFSCYLKGILIVSSSYLYYYIFCCFYCDEVSDITSQMHTSGAVSRMALIGWHNSKENHGDLSCGCVFTCVCWCVCTYYITVQWCNAAPFTKVSAEGWAVPYVLLYVNPEKLSTSVSLTFSYKYGICSI